ncbi:DinB family protein [Saliterribacillus persicus]|uniref:DinB family protein n=1 Tax=Saliterribacillus persicus TaxID=930114 RepID=UPI001FEA40D6|nr:DinB family protein [Saliterribacillus persicus]
MKSVYMKEHFQKMYKQREEIADELIYYQKNEWFRPYEEKWSWGETYYHLYLMLKWFRRLSKVYVPLARPVGTLRKEKPYETCSSDIYASYKEKNKKPMKAPFILIPPEYEKINVSFEWLLVEIDKETKLLESVVANISDDEAGHIRFLDPLANNPNLIQGIDLLGIHERHHFLLCKKYYHKAGRL